MTNNFENGFEEARLAYQPKLPHLLECCDRVFVREEEKAQVATSIASVFPNSFHRGSIHFLEGNSPPQRRALRVGVLFSGGQASGGHNVIAGLFDALKKIHPETRLFGFLEGPAGLIENRYQELLAEKIALFRNLGGFDMIGSGRTKIESPEQLKTSLETCRALALDGLVIIGGDDSNTNAAFLAEYFLAHECKTSVIGVPKTIDGDLKNRDIEISFGFDTASKVYSEMIGNICRDALSAKKYTHFIKLMGRSASHIALECALQTQPNVTLIGEEIAAKKMTLHQITDELCECICRRAQEGKNYGVILIPEGVIEFIPEMRQLIKELNLLAAQGELQSIEQLTSEARAAFDYLPKEIAQQLLFDRDPHGNVQLSHISTEQLLIHRVKQSLKERRDYQGKFSPVGHFFGYEGRCGYPSNFDANYCTALGYTAAVLVAHGLTGYMSTVRNLSAPLSEWQPAGAPLTGMMALEERKGKMKPVIKKSLVDLEGEAFKYFAAKKKEWVVKDCYRFPGPIQFGGPQALCEATTLTLQLEKAKRPLFL